MAQGEQVHSVFLPKFDSYFIYAGDKRPSLLDALERLMSIKEYNKVLCQWDGKILSLCIAQGRSLLLANTFNASDFVSVMYFVLLSLKSLQLNPEISSVYFMNGLSSDNQVSLYHYFREVKFLTTV